LELLLEDFELPTVIFANHSAWWDGLVAFQLSRSAKLDSFIIMEEKQLRDLFVFRYLGAFSVVRENPRTAKQSLDYAVKTLREKSGRTLWIFPQGQILPNDVRPLKFYNGLGYILKNLVNCRIINLAIKYEFGGTFKPDIFVRIRESDLAEKISATDKKTISILLSQQMTVNLDRLKLDIINQETFKYKNII
jgi:1-acyl-sn-glycerol-3-phosphate acyltransferase